MVPAAGSKFGRNLGEGVIKGIRTIKGFGVFADYARPTDILPFAEKNILYGWNYSGKTTLSRLFHCLESKALHRDYPRATFAIESDSGVDLTHHNLATCPNVVRVFNSDFVAANIKWDGTAFNPVLLLGAESIQIEAQIQRKSKILARCRRRQGEVRRQIQVIDERISDAKTEGARQIRQRLKITETFTAAHINQLITGIAIAAPSEFLVPADQLDQVLAQATTDDNDKLAEIDVPILSSPIADLLPRCQTLVAEAPAVSSAIAYLRENPAVAVWIERGLTLHQHKDHCEFCAGTIDPERIQGFREHFSTALEGYRSKLRTAITQVTQARLDFQGVAAHLFYRALRADADSANRVVVEVVGKINAALEKISTALSRKLDAPFDTVNFPDIDSTIDDHLLEAVQKLYSVVTQHNQITQEFADRKAAALETMKNHYVAEFCIRIELAKLKDQTDRLRAYGDALNKVESLLMKAIKDLEAKISLAQKGREDMNRRLADLLGGTAIQIEVVKAPAGEQFQLMRGSQVAMNLSEGERTAIAFAFFLSKLCEAKVLSQVIVYIDDPISSLDSNHIFQVYAIIKDFFFKQLLPPKKEWTTTCQQLFVSTHNFEFFALLRKLPGSPSKTRYYQVRRATQVESMLRNMPRVLIDYDSEYHYLYGLIKKYHESAIKDDVEVLLSLPNAVRRFVEMYTMARIPSGAGVEARATMLFGPKAVHVVQVLHHFSHMSNIERLLTSPELLATIEQAVADLIEFLKGDKLHYEALEAAVI